MFARATSIPRGKFEMAGNVLRGCSKFDCRGVDVSCAWRRVETDQFGIRIVRLVGFVHLADELVVGFGIGT
jgi:hypothetical protein